ncbi:glycosyltransferase [Vibrio tubiashii]|uniref:glycosyltransferase n=1 Tax=Vibrio tubiashii TaxID=29498 RepID=UPI00148BBC7C
MACNYVHVITNFTELGGAENTLIKLINASDSNSKHTIVSLMGISPVLISKINRSIEVISFDALSPLKMAWSVFKVKKYLSKLEHVTCVYSWMYHANLVVALSYLLSSLNFPFVWGVRHSLDDYEGEKFTTKLVIRLGLMVSHIPHYTVHCSKKSMQQHLAIGYGESNTSVYIPNGYDFKEYKRRTFDSEKFVFGAAGRFHDSKDYRTLFEAIAPILISNKSYRLKLAGRGMTPCNTVVIRFMEELLVPREQVDLLGEVDDMPSFYQSIDFFILSSKTEGFPNVLAEASGYGCIPFSTNVGDAELIIGSERIVEIKNSRGLTLLLEEYLSKEPRELMHISQSTSKITQGMYDINIISSKFFSLGEKKKCAV